MNNDDTDHVRPHEESSGHGYINRYSRSVLLHRGDKPPGINLFINPDIIETDLGKLNYEHHSYNTSSPNRLVNMPNLERTITSGLLCCSTCGKSNLEVNDKVNSGLASSIEIVCNYCNKEKEILTKGIEYLCRKINCMSINDKKQRAKRRQTYMKMYHKKRKLTDL